MGLQMDRHPLGGGIRTSGKSLGFAEFLVDGFRGISELLGYCGNLGRFHFISLP